jgi:hypothetical protein
MSTLRIDTIITYPGLHGRPAQCQIRVFDQAGGDAVLVATDIGDANPGASVTNTIEHIATEVCRRYRLDPARLTVVEHYDDRRTPRAFLLGRENGESFDVVTFRRMPATAGDGTIAEGAMYAAPMWRRINKQQAEALVGQPLP